jgi:hypothetical protein
MFILHSLLKEFKEDFAHSRKGDERSTWFIYSIIAITIPFTSSKTSNLLWCLQTLFGFSLMTGRRYYTFMASSKLPWEKLWKRVWKMIPDPLTEDKLIVALDDCINPKTGKKIFACHNFFDHAAKDNQSKYPWAQNFVAVGLLKVIKGRWAFLPLASRFYHLKKDLCNKTLKMGKQKVEFHTKFEQAVNMITEIANCFEGVDIITVTDSWFGNKGLWKPLREVLGSRFNMISRLRANANLFALPSKSIGRGRPRIYGEKLGNASLLADEYCSLATELTVNLYGKVRTILAYESIFMIKTLKCQIKVVWVFRNNQWVTLFSTDTTLSIKEIVEYYGARWKIEAGFKELKRDIGSAESQTRNPFAVTNHLQFCLMATSLTWIYADLLEKAPNRRHAINGRKYFAFSDIRRCIAKEALDDNFNRVFPVPHKTVINSVIATLLRIAA